MVRHKVSELEQDAFGVILEVMLTYSQIIK